MLYKSRILSLVLTLSLITVLNDAKADCDNLTMEAPAVAWGSTASAQTNDILKTSSEQITFYYQNKDTKKVQDIIKDLNMIPNKHFLSSLPNQGAFRALSGFLMGVFMENPGLYNEYRQQTNTDDVNYILDDAFFLSSHIKSFLPKSQNLCLDSTSLDMYWGYFFATGDKRAVVTIKTTANRAQACKEDRKNCIKTYCKKEGCTRDELTLFASDMSAEWSLNSNAKYHQIVKEVLGK